MSDLEKFPHPVYRETVLEPLFEGVKAHYAAHMADINQAHLVMLTETGILQKPQASDIARALSAIAETDLSSLRYSDEHEDYFFYSQSPLI